MIVFAYAHAARTEAQAACAVAKFGGKKKPSRHKYLIQREIWTQNSETVKLNFACVHGVFPYTSELVLCRQTY